MITARNEEIENTRKSGTHWYKEAAITNEDVAAYKFTLSGGLLGQRSLL